MGTRKLHSEMTEAEQRAQAAENAHVFLVRALAETLMFCKKNYSNGFKTVTDESFDKFEDELRKLCPNHPVLTAVGNSPFAGNLLGIVETRALIKANEAPKLPPMPPVPTSSLGSFM